MALARTIVATSVPTIKNDRGSGAANFCCNKSNHGSNQSSDELYTISFEDAIKRIVVILGVELDNNTYRQLKSLNRYRNQLIHGDGKGLPNKVEYLMAGLLQSIISILKQNLPLEDSKKFANYMDGEGLSKLQPLYDSNDAWRFTTMAGLLKSIENNPDKNLLPKKHLEELSFLGCIIEDDDSYYDFYDNSCLCINNYNSASEYLNEEICKYVIFSGFSLDSPELEHFNDFVIDVCKRYIKALADEIVATIRLYSQDISSLVLGGIGVDKLFDGISLTDKVQFYIHIAVISSVEKCKTKTKRHNDFRREMALMDFTLDSLYTVLMKWYNSNGWFNNFNKEKLDKNVLNMISMENWDIQDEIDINIFNDIIGGFGSWRNIDSIEDFYIQETDFIIKNSKEDGIYALVIWVSVKAQAYADGMFLDNGSVETYITADGFIDQNNHFKCEQVEYLGCKKLINSFST